MAFERIELNICPAGDMPVFHCSQYDTGRPIIIDLKNGDDAFTPSAGTTFELHCRKVDDNIVTLDTYEVDGNTLTFTSTEQLCACSGDNLCEVAIYLDELCMGTLNFMLHVEPDPLAGGLESETQIYNLTEQVEEITEQVIGDNYYDKTEVDDLLDTKADASTTYTKTEVDTALNLKADRSTTYTKTETNNLLAGKADASDTYSKAQVDSKLSLKADKATTYTKTETDTLLGYKANASQVYTMSQTDLLLADKADKLTTYTKTQVDNALALKANSADLATVATTGDYDDLLNKPSIPAAQVQSDYAQSDNTKVDYIKNKPDIDAMIGDALLAVMPVDTASGPIATFDTELAVPLVNVSCDVVATGGNGTPDNPIPIVGYSSANITRCGVNLFDGTWEIGHRWDGDGSYTSQSDRNAGTPDKIPCKPNTTYTFVMNNISQITYMYLSEFDVNENHIQKSSSKTITTSTKYVTFTTGANTFFIALSLYANAEFTSTEVSETGVNYPATDTTYHAYNGQTYAIAFGQTVYGGVLDVTRGKLHVTKSRIDMGSLGWLYNSGQHRMYAVLNGSKMPTDVNMLANILCEIYKTDTFYHVQVNDSDLIIGGLSSGGNSFVTVYDSNYTDSATFANAVTGKYIVYELATPFDIDLTPVQINAIIGTNNVYSDTNGNTTVQFKDSIQHYIDTKVGS